MHFSLLGDLAISSLTSLGLDAFCLDYPVAWPLSIVLSPAALAKYQLLFRLTFSLRSVERLLLQCWSAHAATRAFEFSCVELR